MKDEKKIRVLNIVAGVIIGALIIYIIGVVWFYFSLWIPMHKSQEAGRELDRYIREHGYEEEIRKINPDVNIRSEDELKD